MRIVSLLPSATDTLRGLQALGSLVGRSHEVGRKSECRSARSHGTS
jgi:hypothetical protein